MKTIFTIAAIAMFAVILGMSAIAPAMASKPEVGVNHRIEFCHYQEAKPAVIDPITLVVLEEEVLEDYLVIETDNKGQMNGHFKNEIAHHFPVDENDVPIEDGQGDFLFEDVDAEDVNDSEADCIALHEEFNPDPVE